jgi:hypothetical protein
MMAHCSALLSERAKTEIPLDKPAALSSATVAPAE